MVNMKDVPSTERMVLCSQQWKLLSQKEKDAYHKKCDQVSYAEELLETLGPGLRNLKHDIWPQLGVSQELTKRISGACCRLGGVWADVYHL